MTLSVLAARSRDRNPLDFSGLDATISVRTVHTETELLDAVRASSFDCLVVDHELDSGSGLSALETVRSERPTLPVVFCTAQPDGQVASEATRHGIDAYHIYESDGRIEKRIVELLPVPGQQEDGRAIIADGSAATHGTPFTEIAETLNDAVVTIDSDSYVRFANDQLAELTGYDHGEIVDSQFTKLMPERFRESHHEGIDRYLETGERRVNWDYIELAIQHADGHEIPVAVSFAEFTRGGERFFTGVIRDIRSQKSQARALEQLHEVASDHSLSSLEKIRQVLDNHRERLGVSLAFLGRIDDESEEFIITTGDHESIEEEVTVPIEETYCQYAMERRDPLVLPNVEETETVPEDIYERYGLSCYLGETVYVGGEPYGTICFADDSRAEDEFDESDIAFLEVLADWVGYELTENRQREQLERERKRTEQILERVDDAFFAVNDDWEFTYFNTRAEEVLGRSREEVIGRDIWECFPEAVDSTFSEQYHTAMETQEHVVFEEFYPPLDTWFEVNAYPSEDGLSVYFSDITERKEYTEALARMHDQTRELVRAGTFEEIAQTVVDATSEVIEQEFCGVRILEDDRLKPLSISVPTQELVGERPAYDADCWGPGDALTGQNIVIVDQPVTRARETDSGPKPEAVEPFSELLFVPIGEYGTLSVGRTDGTFDEADRSLVELLASHAAMAFERAEREAELRTNETVLETLQGMVYAIDTEGEFELVTEPLAAWLGYDRAELQHGGPEMMLPESERGRFWESIEGLRESDDDHVTAEIEMRAATGETLPAEVELSLTPDDGAFAGSIGVVRDRSELEKARQQLESERDRFRYLFDNLPDAVSEARFEDGEPVVETVNEAFEDVFGYEEAELLGNPLNEFILPEEAKREGQEIDRTAASGEYWSGEVRRQTAEGRRDFLFRGVPFTGTDGTQRGFGIYTDITDRKQRERRLQVLTRVLRHNLRNELTVLLGYAELLREKVDDEELLSAVESVCDGIDNVSDLSEDAREIQKILANGGPGQEKQIGDVVDPIISEYGHPDVEFDVDLSPVTVTVDGRLRLALRHLVENAVEHGGDRPRIRVRSQADGDALLVTVEDSGPGIPELEWNVVAGNTEITQLSHGSGLGLWAVKWVVESYGGQLERFETPLGGTGIRLQLPGIVAESR